MKEKEKKRNTVLTERQVMDVADDIIRRDILHRNRSTENCITSTEVARRIGLTCLDLLSVLEDMGVVVFRNRHYEIAPQTVSELEPKALYQHLALLHLLLQPVKPTPTRKHPCWPATAEDGVDFVIRGAFPWAS